VTLAVLHNRKLRTKGWIVIRIWEHELRRATDFAKFKTKILRAINNRERSIDAYIV
jgi:G:T-mismatch repair DNA endonuclease (very short patch repair protein)